MEGFEKSSVAFIARIIKSKTGLSSELLKNSAFISYKLYVYIQINNFSYLFDDTKICKQGKICMLFANRNTGIKTIPVLNSSDE